MWQRRDLLTQHRAVFAHRAGADLQQVVEMRGHQMHLFDLCNPGHGGIELGQCGFAGVVQFDLDKGHMVQPQPDRIDQRAVTGDDALCLQPPEPTLGGGLRQADAAGQIGDGDPPVLAQHIQNRPVEAVHICKVHLT